MQEVSDISAVAHVIQLSIAPVFLLTGIAGMLNVMTNRLNRVIDRGRALEAKLSDGTPQSAHELHKKLATLSRRAKLINRAITLCTLTAVLVCTLIVILFLGAFLHFTAALSIAFLFILAMLSLVFGLVSFLQEIFVATANLRIGVQ